MRFYVLSTATVWNGSAQIGGPGTGQANTIVNSTGYGISITGAASSANPLLIRANRVGILANGTAAGNTSGGIFINGDNGIQIGGTSAGEGNVISGNSSNATMPGIRIDASTNIVVQGNTIGLGIDGTTKVANGYGILLASGANTNITIGGNTASARNLISGNVTQGISISSSPFTSASNNTIQGNYIGLDKNGNVVTGATGGGMSLTNPNDILIGGATAGEGNVISGNPGTGIVFSGPTGQGVRVYGNTIGLKPDGETVAANGTGISSATNNSPTGTLLIGGATAGQGNIISGNTGNGISLTTSSMAANTTVIKGNKIGTSTSGAAKGNGANGISATSVTGLIVGGIGTGEGNTIANNVSNGVAVDSASSQIAVRGNSIAANGKVGIDLRGSANAPDANDLPSALDVDTGGNGLQNFPQRTTLTKCDASTEQATYLWSAANTTYTVDFYANPSGRDTTGYGEGEQYVSSTTVTTSAAGYASITPPAGVTNLSMTVTDPSGNTSEFSDERAVSISGCTVTTKSTSDTTPSLAGTTTLTGFVAGATPTTAALTINGQNVNASITSPSWTLADNTLTVLPAGSYNVGVSVTDPVSKLSTSYSAANALTIDTTSPTVTVNQSSGQADPTSVDSASFDIVFSEDVSTLTVADITLSGTTGTVTTLTKVDNKTYRATVTGMASGGTATMTIAAAKVTDSAGNTNAASTSTDNQVTYDTTAPTVTINQSAGQADPTNVNSASFSIVFSEPVTTLTTSGINLSGTSGTVTTLTKVDASHYTAIVTGMANGDTVTAVVNAGAVKDLAGNDSAASTSTDNQVTYDASRSDVAITRKTGQAAHTQTNSAWFTVTLTKPAADGTFTSSDINPGTTTGTVTTLSKIDNLHYEFEVTGMTTGDSATPSIAAGTFTDAIGNTNYASTGDANNWVMYDVTAPNAFAVNLDVTSSGHDMDHPLVSWSTTDGQSGIDHYTMSVDGGSFSTVTSPQSVTLTPAASHTIVVRAYDKAGNMREKTVVYPPIENITAPTTLSNVAITDTTIKITGPSGMIITSVDISGAGSSGFTCTPAPSSTTTVPITCSGGQITTTGILTVAATTDAGVTTQNTQDYTIDTIKPSVTINQAVTQADPTNVDSAKFTVVFSKAINPSSFTASDITLSGTTGTVTGFTQVDSRTWTVTVTGMTDGDAVTATLAANKVTDLAGNNNIASTSTDDQITYDTTKPTVTINQTAGQADPTNSATMNFTATFSEPVSGLSTSGIQISGSLTAHVSAITAVSGSIYTVTVIGATDGDTVKATILAGAATDAAGNANTASTSADNQITYDSTPPSVTINQAAGQTDPTNINSAKFDIVFSEDVSTLTASGIALTGTTGAVTTLTKVDARHYTATVTGMTDADVATAAVKTSVVSDASGNSNTASTSTDNQVTYDTTQPTVTVNQVAGQADPTNQDYATFRIVFSEPVQASSFTYDDLTITGTTGSVASLTQIDSTTWDVVISGMTNGDIATVSLLASKVTDLAGNANTASTSTDNQVTYDTTQPTVTVNQAAGQADPTNSNSAQFTIVFSKPVTVLDTSKLQLSGSTSAIISNVAAVSSTTYTVTISSMTNGDTVSLAAAADAATDIAGNASTASTSTDNHVTYDTTAPNATVHTLVTNDSTPVVAGTISDPSATVIVTINGIDYPATNNGDGTWTLSDNTISPALTDGLYDVTIKTADTAGNENTSTAASSLTIDTTAPTGTITPVAPSITNSPALSGTITDPTAVVTVVIDGVTYTATNHEDGTWSLPAGTIAPALTPGTHTATVTFSDAAGNRTTQSTDLTIQRPDADPPTVNPVDWVGGTPVITGTYDATNSQSLTVTVNGVTYTLGSSPELTASGNNWTLNLSNLSAPLPAGSYDVKVQVTTRSAGTLGDTTATELTVLPVAIPAIITNPGAGLARTGMAVWMVVAGGVGLVLVSVGLVWVVARKRK